MNILSTSGINSLINSYTANETNRRINPLQTQKSKYSNLSSVWGTLSSKLSTLQTVATDLKSTTSTSIFNSSSATLSSPNFFSVTTSSGATPSSYSLRVNQLAKGDLAVSNTMTSATAVTTMAGTHQIKIQSGTNTSTLDVTLTASETNQSVMDAINSAISNDTAVVNSASLDGSTAYTGSGSFSIDVNGTATTINYNYSSGFTYSTAMDDLVSQINSGVSGVTAKKVTNGLNVSLQITVNDKSQYITIDNTTDTGTLLNSSNLNINVTKEIAASASATGSVFTPSTGNSKFSITAANSGYDNRLIMSDVTGSALNFLGLTSTILDAHTVTTSNTAAGFIYDTTSSTSNQLNSVVDFNGITVNRNSNTISDLVSNVTFNLKAEMQSTDTTVTATVKSDTTTIKNKITDFITKFNDVYTTIKNNYFSGKSGRGIFAGDSTALSLMNSLRNNVTSQVSGITSGNLSYLSEVGITFDPATGLTLSDSAKLTSALDNTPTQVAALFNSTSGIANNLYNVADAYTGISGSITNITDSLNNNVSYLNDRITSTQSSITKSAVTLRKQYEQLQLQLASLLQSQQLMSLLGGGLFG